MAARKKSTRRDPNVPPWWDLEETPAERHLIDASDRIVFADRVMDGALNQGVRAGDARRAREAVDAIERALVEALKHVRAAEMEIRSRGLAKPRRLPARG